MLNEVRKCPSLDRWGYGFSPYWLLFFLVQKQSMQEKR